MYVCVCVHACVGGGGMGREREGGRERRGQVVMIDAWHVGRVVITVYRVRGEASD